MHDSSGLVLRSVSDDRTPSLLWFLSIVRFPRQKSTKDSNFDGADFTNAIVDRATFKGSSLKGAIFKNTVLTGTNFEGADVEGADFTEAALGSFDIKTLCKNPTLKGENPTTGADTKFSVGCGGF